MGGCRAGRVAESVNKVLTQPQGIPAGTVRSQTRVSGGTRPSDPEIRPFCSRQPVRRGVSHRSTVGGVKNAEESDTPRGSVW